MDDSCKPVVKMAGYLLGAMALVPIAYYGLTFVVPARCPECDAQLDIIKRSGDWEPDLVSGDDL